MKPKYMPLEEPLEFIFVLHVYDSRRIDRQLSARDLDPVESRLFTDVKIHTLYCMSERAVPLVIFRLKLVHRQFELKQRTQGGGARPEHRSGGKIQQRGRID